MTAVAFDTLKFARALRERAHLSAEQAEGLSEVFAEAVQGGLPTRADLQGLEGSVKAEFVAVRAEIAAFQAETKANSRPSERSSRPSRSRRGTSSRRFGRNSRPSSSKPGTSSRRFARR